MASRETVLMLITRPSARSPSARPPGPLTTSARASGPVTMMTTAAAVAASSAGVSWTVTPSRRKGSARSGLRLYTWSPKPALRTFRAMGAPMVPRPMKPTVSLMGSSCVCGFFGSSCAMRVGGGGFNAAPGRSRG